MLIIIAIGGNQSSSPEISISTNSQHFIGNFSRVVCSEVEYVLLPPKSFAGLWKFYYIHVLSLNHEPLWLPSNGSVSHVFLGYSITPNHIRTLDY